MKRSILTTFLFLGAVNWGLAGCGEGEGGSTGIDCGDHGSEHEGHCHCDSGYLFDSITCVDPSEISAVCEEHEEEAEEEHDHGACLCPTTGVCPCDHGEIESYGSSDYCVPELHEE